jgi:hypothetical protein
LFNLKYIIAIERVRSGRDRLGSLINVWVDSNVERKMRPMLEEYEGENDRKALEGTTWNISWSRGVGQKVEEVKV